MQKLAIRKVDSTKFCSCIVNNSFLNIRFFYKSKLKLWNPVTIFITKKFRNYNKRRDIQLLQHSVTPAQYSSTYSWPLSSCRSKGCMHAASPPQHQQQIPARQPSPVCQEVDLTATRSVECLLLCELWQ